jgi:hypothetical protein
VNITAHASRKIGSDTALHTRVMLAATQPTVRYESRRNGGGFRHIRAGIVAVVDRGSLITFYVDQEETPLRPDQIDADALAHAAKVASEKVSRAVRDQKKNARRDRDRALTFAQKGKKA